MPSSYTDQFLLIDAFSPPPAGNTLHVHTFDMIDADDDGDIGRNGDDSIDGSDVIRAYPGDSITVRWPDGAQSKVTGTTLYLADGREVFTPTDGTVLDQVTLVSTTYVTGSGSLDVDLLGPACLVSGTKVSTPQGPRAVETLSEGDEILAADGRILTLRGVMSTQVSQKRQRRSPHLRPIRIVAGALGGGVPTRDLLVSRQHRMVIKSAIAERMFGQSEVLVAAAKLLDVPGVFVDPTLEEVGYFHLVFDDHEIIVAEGAETESLLIGPGIMKSLGSEAVRELIALFPQVSGGEVYTMPARPIPSRKRTNKLMARLAKNNHPIVAQAGKR
jgi:hypothetical protein